MSEVNCAYCGRPLNIDPGKLREVEASYDDTLAGTAGIKGALVHERCAKLVEAIWLTMPLEKRRAAIDEYMEGEGANERKANH